MALKEIKTEVIELKEYLAIPLPLGFCEGTALKKGSELKITYTKRGNFEVRISKPTTGHTLCQICNKRSAKSTCKQCGSIVCSSCFWEGGNLCY